MCFFGHYQQNIQHEVLQCLTNCFFDHKVEERNINMTFCMKMTRFVWKVLGDDALRDLQERWLKEELCVGVTEADDFVGGGLWRQAVQFVALMQFPHL